MDDTLRRFIAEHARNSGISFEAAEGQLRAQLSQALAQRSLLEFGERCYHGFDAPRHIQFLADLLERAERQDIRRLAISIAPGHGKSTLLQLFMAWFLGRDPGRRILALSASEKLAQRNSLMVRTLVQDELWPWPEVKLVGEALEEWRTKQMGGVRSIGRTGTVTGFRAEMVLCDDLQPDAGTETSRPQDEEWFRQVLSTRLEPSGIVVLIQTRWHDGDIIGRLQEGESAKQWMFVNIPVLAGEDDPLGREPGAALWPARFDEKQLAAVRQEVGPVAFGAQYQGDPAPAGGNMFRTEWLSHTYESIPTVRAGYQVPVIQPWKIAMMSSQPAVPGVLRIAVIDAAASKGISSDSTAIAILVTDYANIYVERVITGHYSYPELKACVHELMRDVAPAAIYVEYTSNGQPLVDEMAATSPIPIIPIKIGNHGKEQRAESVLTIFEAGKVKFPKSAPWLRETILQLARFPAGAHDDIVDAIVHGVMQIQVAMVRSLQAQQWEDQVGGDDWMAR